MKRAEQFDDFKFTEESPGYYAGLSTRGGSSAGPGKSWKVSTPVAYFILGAISVLVAESLFAFFLPGLVNSL